jgi:hypothetical protein
LLCAAYEISECSSGQTLQVPESVLSPTTHTLTCTDIQDEWWVWDVTLPNGTTSRLASCGVTAGCVNQFPNDINVTATVASSGNTKLNLFH